MRQDVCIDNVIDLPKGESTSEDRISLEQIEQYFLGTLEAEERERVRAAISQPDHYWQRAQGSTAEFMERLTGCGERLREILDQ